MTPKEAGEAPKSRSSRYPSWQVIEKAVSGEPAALQDKEAFERRKDRADQLYQSAKNGRLSSALVIIWLVSVSGYLVFQISSSSGILSGITCVCLVAICIAALFLGIKKRTKGKRRRSQIVTRSMIAGLLVLGALAPLLVHYLDGISAVKHDPAASGAVGGLEVIDFALLSALTVLTVLLAIELIRIWTQDLGILLFDRLALLAKELTETGYPDDETFSVQFSDQARLCDLIEQSARTVDAMAYTLARHQDDEALRRGFASVASGLRALKLEVALPEATYEGLAELACKLCMIGATGLYGLFPTATIPASSAPSRRARIAQLGKRTAAAFLPLAVYLLLTIFHFPKQGLPTLGLASLLWLLLYIIQFLDPNYQDVLASLKNIPFS